jgi:hypothetical protein
VLTRTAQRKQQKKNLVVVRRTQNPEFVTKSQVKQMIISSKGEITDKFQNVVMENGVTPVISGTLITPVFPTQGVTSTTRTGDSISLEEIQMRFAFANATATEVDLFRIIILQAKSVNTVTIASVLDSGASGSVDLTSFVNAFALNTEFLLLHDHVYRCCNNSSTGSHLIEFNLVPKIKKINFVPTSTTAETGQVYVIVQGGLTGASDIVVSSMCRYRYRDL